jgi:hypothetical protein
MADQPRRSNPNGPEATPEYLPNSSLHPKVRARKSADMKRSLDPSNFAPGSRKHQHATKLIALRNLRHQAVKNGLVEHGLQPTQVLQRLIDDAFIDYHIEQQQQQDLRAAGKHTAGAKLRALRREAAYFASLALQYSISDRQTRILEAQTQLVATLLQQTLRHPDINLPESKIRKIPAIMEQAAQNLQALAQESSTAAPLPPPTDLVDPNPRIPPHRLAS